MVGRIQKSCFVCLVQLICGDDDQMDRSPDYSDQPSPAAVTSKSRGTSISYGASRSPGQHPDERRNEQTLALPNGRSEQMPTPHTITAGKVPFLSISQDVFSANVYNPPLMVGDSLHGGFVADDYDMTTMNPDCRSWMTTMNPDCRSWKGAGTDYCKTR